MKGYWDNLRPMEKRLVAGVGAMLFVVLNLWFVVPHFSDWGKIQARMAKARRTLAMYDAELRQKRYYEQQVRSMESEGQAVPPEEQITAFARAIQDQQVQSGVAIITTSKINTRTNQFFLEQAQTLSVQAKENQLVDFLYNLGTGNSLMRVRNLTLHTDPSHQQLAASVTVVASYQKNAKSRGAVAVATQTVIPKAVPAPVAKSSIPAPKASAGAAAAPTNSVGRPTGIRPNFPLGRPNPALPQPSTAKKERP